MTNVQVMYSHSSTLTFRMERITPQDMWTRALNDEDYKIPVYDGESRGIKLLSLKDLMPNRNDYNERGWCSGEKDWAAARSVPAQNLLIDGEEDEEEQIKKIPTEPGQFMHRMATAKFTWANDRDSVIDLQRKIFKQKVTICKGLHLTDLTADDMEELTAALPHYKELNILDIQLFYAETAQCEALVEAQPSRSLSSFYFEKFFDGPVRYVLPCQIVHPSNHSNRAFLDRRRCALCLCKRWCSHVFKLLRRLQML